MTRLALVLALGALLVLPGSSAQAKKPTKDGRSTPSTDARAGHDDPGVGIEVNVVFAPAQRDAVRGWIVDTRGRGHCPPGLAKKNNGCLPPGQAKKRYAVGRPLPHGIDLGPLPGDLEVRLGIPPVGFRYGVIDGDVVKLAVGTLLVVDAIDGLVD